MRILDKRRDLVTKEANPVLLLLPPRFRDYLVDVEVKSGLAPLRPLSSKSSRRQARIDN